MMKRMMILATIWAGLAGGVATVAMADEAPRNTSRPAATGENLQSRLRRACLGEVNNYCREIASGVEAVTECIASRIDRCESRNDTSRPAAPSDNSQWRLRRACVGEVNAYCHEMASGVEAVTECIASRINRCESRNDGSRPAAPSDNPQWRLRRACVGEVNAYCHEMASGVEAVTDCMASRIDRCETQYRQSVAFAPIR